MRRCKCPSCGESGSVENIGGAETYATVVIRRYLCTECGHAWYSEERHLGPINRRILQELQARAEGQTQLSLGGAAA